MSIEPAAPADHATHLEAAAPRPRVDAVDVLRGAVMVLMVLDHTRDYFGNASQNPTDLATSTPALFMTRWITHFCARSSPSSRGRALFWRVPAAGRGSTSRGSFSLGGSG